MVYLTAKINKLWIGYIIRAWLADINYIILKHDPKSGCKIFWSKYYEKYKSYLYSLPAINFNKTLNKIQINYQNRVPQATSFQRSTSKGGIVFIKL